MIRLGQLPANNPHWTEVPYMDATGFCSVCNVHHRPTSSVGRDHATACIWESNTAMRPMSDVLGDILGKVAP